MKARSVVVVDANGNKTIVLLRSSTGAGGIMGGVLNCSEADLLQWWESDVTFNVPAPPGGPYRPVNQVAELTFICADLTQVVVRVPAPSLGIFLADQQTVDSANALVNGLILAAIGNLESSTGSIAVAYLSGTLAPGAKSPL